MQNRYQQDICLIIEMMWDCNKKEEKMLVERKVQTCMHAHTHIKRGREEIEEGNPSINVFDNPKFKKKK